MLAGRARMIRIACHRVGIAYAVPCFSTVRLSPGQKFFFSLASLVVLGFLFSLSRSLRRVVVEQKNNTFSLLAGKGKEGVLFIYGTFAGDFFFRL